MDQSTLLSLFTYDAVGGGLFRKNGKRAGSVLSNDYRRAFIDGKYHAEHRLVWIYFNGSIPDGCDIDHINCVKDDNFIENLRLCTHAENMQNRRRPNSNSRTGFLGIYYEAKRKKYVARIAHNNKDTYLGRFDTAEEASEAYLAAKRKIHPFNTL